MLWNVHLVLALFFSFLIPVTTWTTAKILDSLKACHACKQRNILGYFCMLVVDSNSGFEDGEGIGDNLTMMAWFTVEQQPQSWLHRLKAMNVEFDDALKAACNISKNKHARWKHALHYNHERTKCKHACIDWKHGISITSHYFYFNYKHDMSEQLVVNMTNDKLLW